MAELESCAMDLEKQLEESASRMRLTESNFSFFNDKVQTLKQRSGMGVSCDGEM